MSDSHSTTPDDDGVHGHEGPIRTPKQLVWTIIASFVIPIIAIILLVNFVAFGNLPGAGSDGFDEQTVAQRLQRVGSLELRDASAPRVMQTGEHVYNAQCAACHAAGLAGAPKFGDSAAWSARLRTGYAALLESVVKGKGAMAAQGGGEYSDFELGRAVVYLANHAGGSLPEPEAPAPAATAASAPN